MRYLYVGEVGYGNLGDDACAALVRREMGNGLLIRNFSNFGQEQPPDVLLVGGGTLLSMTDEHWMRILATGSGHAKKTAILGTGVDPGIPWNNRGVETVQHMFRHIAPEYRGVRGPISQAMLRVIGIDTKIVGDPMFLYKPPKFRRRNRVAIVPGHQGRSVGGPHFHERMCLVINAIDAPIIYVPVWIRDVGLERAYINETQRGRAYYPGASLDDTARLLGECKAVITNRMHAGLLAMICGVPAFFIAHHIKVTDLCRALNWRHYAPANEPDLPGQCAQFVRDAERLTLPWPQILGFREAIKTMLESLR